MKKVILKPLHHRNQECIGIYFENSSVLNRAIQKNAGAKWSRTNKCWYVILSKESYNKLAFALKGKAEIEQTLTAYPTRTVQQIFSNVKQKAGIRKEVGIHSLRYSFAMHLLDKGTDIRYIKDLLGHFNLKTTERYLHVSKKQLVNIISPFDDLWRTNEIDW